VGSNPIVSTLCDVSGHPGQPEPSLGVGLLWFSGRASGWSVEGLVVEGEVAEEFAGGGVDDPASMIGDAVSAHMSSDEPERLQSKVLRALDRSPYEPYTGSSEGTVARTEAASEPGYSGKRAAEIVGISYRQLDYWARTDLVRPSISDAHGSGMRRRYSYRNLLELKLIKTLLENRIALDSVRRAFTYIRDQLGEDVSAATKLIIAGNSVVLVHENEELADVVNRYRGQGVLNLLAFDSIKEQVDAAIDASEEQTDPATVEDDGG
jgi:DNA-binding transcriptional MerR regulator